MARLAEALVGVAVVHGDEVHVAEDKAVIVVLLQGLCVAHVQQLSPVKRHITILKKKAHTGKAKGKQFYWEAESGLGSMLR